MLASCPSEFNRELERGEEGTEAGLVDLPQSKSHLEIKMFDNISCKTNTSSHLPKVFGLSILTSKDKFKYVICLLVTAVWFKTIELLVHLIVRISYSAFPIKKKKKG